MIQITRNVAIDENAIDVSFTRSSGPGGQKVNSSATAVQLRFDVSNASLSDDVRERLVELAGNRITRDGELIIEASDHRTQGRNRQAALDRLVKMIRQATKKPTPRRKTKPTAASERRRLENKRRHSEKKRRRQFTPRSDYW